jgi:hypothetical protein
MKHKTAFLGQFFRAHVLFVIVYSARLEKSKAGREEKLCRSATHLMLVVLVVANMFLSFLFFLTFFLGVERCETPPKPSPTQ